jgi:hypothetical protein
MESYVEKGNAMDYVEVDGENLWGEAGVVHKYEKILQPKVEESMILIRRRKKSLKTTLRLTSIYNRVPGY